MTQGKTNFGAISVEDRQRLFDRVKVGGPDDCWLWLGGINGPGYGILKIDGDQTYVHRVVYNLYKGEIGDYQINHHCDITNCVNPHHLYKGDKSSNAQDLWDRGRRSKEEVRGEGWHASKLTDAQAEEIKDRIEAGDETYAQIAEDYPVTKSTIGSIAAGDIWTYDDKDDQETEDAPGAHS